MASKYTNLSLTSDARGMDSGPGIHYPIVRQQSSAQTDMVEFMYACGHVLRLGNTALAHGQPIPNTCAMCEQAYLTKKWVSQQEAKAYSNVAVASVGSHPAMTREPTAFEWLDFAIDKTRRRAFAL